MPRDLSSTNHLLLSLASEDFDLIEPCLTKMNLKRRHIFIEPYQPIEHVYFLEDGIASIVASYEDGSEVEVGIIGREGMIGHSVLLGTDLSPHKVYMQLDGTIAWRMESKSLLNLLGKSETLSTTLLRYIQATITQSGQTAAINARFDIPQRLARWLLMCHDRIDGDLVYLTHEMIAIMLGVRRPGVTEAIAFLAAKTGSIKGHRGHTEIVNRKVLESFASSAYGVPEAEYRRLVGYLGNGAYQTSVTSN